ncbi:MAG: hypothetical protein IPH59_03680 [bacterium]|nr:hypothetical protein [bacterium]
MKSSVISVLLFLGVLTLACPTMAQEHSEYCGGIITFATGTDSAYLHSGDVVLLPVHLALAHPVTKFKLEFGIDDSGMVPVFFVPSPDLFSDSEAMQFEMTPRSNGFSVTWTAPENRAPISGTFVEVGKVAVQAVHEGDASLHKPPFSLRSSGKTWIAVDSSNVHSRNPLDYLVLRSDFTDINARLVSQSFGPVFAIGFEQTTQQFVTLDIFNSDNKKVRQIPPRCLPCRKLEGLLRLQRR